MDLSICVLGKLKPRSSTGDASGIARLSLIFGAQSAFNRSTVLVPGVTERCQKRRHGPEAEICDSWTSDIQLRLRSPLILSICVGPRGHSSSLPWSPAPQTPSISRGKPKIKMNSGSELSIRKVFDLIPSSSETEKIRVLCVF